MDTAAEASRRPAGSARCEPPRCAGPEPSRRAYPAPRRAGALPAPASIRAMIIPTAESHTRISRDAMVNAFLVKEEDGLPLIDPGLKGNGKQLLADAHELGQTIVRIALTHAHGDHIGGLD